ncbi:MAG: MCE family protein [Propionibacteriales bacterium]|nr:MCE family protein [Propionibacteriales bacterium]
MITELGAGFMGTGDDLGQIIDTSNSFIQAANQNFDVTTALIRDGNTVLTTQAAKGSAIRSFARDLALFSGVVADNDDALRALIANGSATANELRTFLERNQVDLGSLINNLVTTGNVIVKHLPGIRQILVLYPYMVAGGFTVAAKNSEGYNARFGFILTQNPAVCRAGYDPGERRTPLQTDDKAMDSDARCTEPASKSNARGAQNAPRTSPVATYDLDSGTTGWNDRPAPYAVEDPWTALLVQP